MQEFSKTCYNKESVLKEAALIVKPQPQALLVAQTAHQHKALDLRILKVSQHCDYADYFVLMSASSPRHARALADAIEEKSEGVSRQPEGYAKGEWILMDLGDVIAHIFLEPCREYYNFDKLWGHVPVYSLESFSSPAKQAVQRN